MPFFTELIQKNPERLRSRCGGSRESGLGLLLRIGSPFHGPLVCMRFPSLQHLLHAALVVFFFTPIPPDPELLEDR